MASLLSLSANPPAVRNPLSIHSSFFQAKVVTHLRPNPSVLCLPIKLHQRRLTVVSKAGFAAETAVSATRLRLDNLGPQLGKGRGHAAGQGGSCGFGMRGQKSRSGLGVRRGFEGGQMPLYRRIPKLHGIAGGCHYKVLPLHLFCNSCVQRITESRRRKCPVCAASFGPNDVRRVYLTGNWGMFAFVAHI